MVTAQPGETPELLTRLEDGVLRCVLNRPRQLNALTPEMLFALADAVERFSADGLRAVVLEGAGERAFSAGFDLKVLASRGTNAHAGRPIDRAIASLLTCGVPTIALVRGYCLGAGLDLALACDFRLAVPDAKFGIPAVRIGTVYEPRSVDRIQKLLGIRVTKRLFMMGQEFMGQTALDAGLVDELVIDGTLDQALQGWTGSSANAPAAVAAHKTMIDVLSQCGGRGKGFWEPLDALRMSSLKSEERREAVSTFASAKQDTPKLGREDSDS